MTLTKDQPAPPAEPCATCDGKGSFDAPKLASDYQMPMQYICTDCNGTGRKT